MKSNIDLTEDRDFNKRKNIQVRGSLTRSTVINGTGINNAGLMVTNDNFITRLYTSESVKHLMDNMEKICDRCGKYDYFNLMKASLCNRCDNLLEEEFKEESFLTGNRELIKLKKARRSKMVDLRESLVDINGERMRLSAERIPWS